MTEKEAGRCDSLSPEILSGYLSTFPGILLTMRHPYVQVVSKAVEQLVHMGCFALVLFNLEFSVAIFALFSSKHILVVMVPCDLL